MPVIHITKTTVEKLPLLESGRVDYSDDVLKGFGVRISTTCKTYFTIRRVNGKQVRTKIDTTDKITAEMARKRAEGTLADMGRGVDPNEGKRQARKEKKEEDRQKITLQAALDEYLQKGKLKPRTIETYRNLCRLYLADWLERPAAEITRDMVKTRHLAIASGKRERQRLTKKVTPTGDKEIAPPLRREAAADNCMRTLRAVLNYAFEDEEGGTPYMNPVNILSSRKRKAWYQVERRRTLIKNSELPAWFRAVSGLDNTIMRDYLLFLLFTGLRRQEAATLQWKQVDFQEGCFTIVETKNSDPHTLPLSGYLQALLTDRKEGLKTELTEAKAALADAGKLPLKQQQAAFNRVALAESRLASQYVFPGEGKTGYIVEPRRAIGEVTAITGIKFSCHDLRRTFATLAESLDLSSYTVKALLNHKQQLGDVTGGYIILNVDRLREPMQKITDAIQERIKKQHGQIVQMQAKG
ncbi:MAG: integrase family protein [Proteobacteria bacterium]|nr:tyrosine-type recombinase/integrase [Desulfocapsa sp.]MBU3943464.1 integrase family protein [Pseudomonadota bacterium]MCG2745493.1 integrase family protein [Desulfobacteraceae bacterium]MBU4028953.1 integrase family protein [Pseudomonadota bacterium]MBU4043825.1 integrase family protein [Pseudomonadota bacterium]